MNRTLIVAKIAPGAEPDVAMIFGRSDATGLPEQLGVTSRSLFTFHGLYFHLIEFDGRPEQAMATAQRFPGFRAISDELRPHISAYDPVTWKSPQDAMARCFYHWTRSDGRAVEKMAPSTAEHPAAQRPASA